MVKDHLDSERGNLLLPPSDQQQGFFYMHHPTDTICSHGTMAGTRNSSMGPPWRIDSTTHHTTSEHAYHGATSCSFLQIILQFSVNSNCPTSLHTRQYTQIGLSLNSQDKLSGFYRLVVKSPVLKLQYRVSQYS